MGRRQGITSTTSRIRSRRNARRSSTWVSTTGSSETRSSARTCLTPVALRTCVARWTNWRTKSIRTTWLQKKFEDTELTGGFVHTKLVPIRCQSSIDLTSSKHCQLCDSWKTKRMQLISKDGRKAIARLGGTGKIPGGIFHLRQHRDDGPSTDRSGKPAKKVIGPLIRGMIIRINLLKYSSKFGNSQEQFIVTDGVCKHYTSKYRKMATEILHENSGLRCNSYENEVNTASQIKTGTTRTTCCSPSTTPIFWSTRCEDRFSTEPNHP